MARKALIVKARRAPKFSTRQYNRQNQTKTLLIYQTLG